MSRRTFEFKTRVNFSGKISCNQCSLYEDLVSVGRRTSDCGDSKVRNQSSTLRNGSNYWLGLDRKSLPGVLVWGTSWPTKGLTSVGLLHPGKGHFFFKWEERRNFRRREGVIWVRSVPVVLEKFNSVVKSLALGSSELQGLWESLSDSLVFITIILQSVVNGKNKKVLTCHLKRSLMYYTMVLSYLLVSRLDS